MDLTFRFDAQVAYCLIHVDRSLFGKKQTGRMFYVERGTVLGDGAEHHVVPLPPGHLHVLLGRNGSGKSLLLDSLRSTESSGARLVSTSLILSLAGREIHDEWQRNIAEELALFRELSDDERGGLGPEDLLPKGPPVMTALRDALDGAGPGDMVASLDMTAEDLLTYLGCEPEEIRSWSSNHRYRSQFSFGFTDPQGPPSWDLSMLVGEFIVGATGTLPHNLSESVLELPWGDGQVLSASSWLNEPSKRDLIVPAVREFLSSMTHVELNGRQRARLLAPMPDSGPLRSFLELQRSEVADFEYPVDPRLPFPIGLFEPFSLGGLPYVASYELDVQQQRLFEVIDVSPVEDREPLAIAFDALASGLVKVTATSSDETVGITVTGVEQLRVALDAVSSQIAQCEVGISEVALMWPPRGADWWGHREVPSGEQWSLFRVRAGATVGILPFLQWRDAVSGQWLDLEHASRGQRDVLALFVQLARLEVERGAHMSIEDRHVILFSDEFDKSLHPTASTAVLERLAALAEQLPAVSIVVSTHNVSALSRPALRGVSRIFASRSNDDFRYIESLNSTVDVVAEALGASFLDALKLKRLHVLVEGSHDELVIGDVLKDQIPEIRDVEIVNGGGVNAWSGIIANSLRFLDAPILLMHDKRDGELEREWVRHQGIYRRTGRLPSWGDTGLSTMLFDLGVRRRKGRWNKGDGELERLLWLLKDNVFDRDHSLASRIFVFGLDCDDIVDLLPISAFPKAKRFPSWAAAHDDFNTRHPRAGGEKFKYEFGINDRSVRDALNATMDSVHPELGRLCGAVRDLLDHGQLPSDHEGR